MKRFAEQQLKAVTDIRDLIKRATGADPSVVTPEELELLEKHISEIEVVAKTIEKLNAAVTPKKTEEPKKEEAKKEPAKPKKKAEEKPKEEPVIEDPAETEDDLSFLD